MKKSLFFVFMSVVFFAVAGIALTGCMSPLATASYNGQTDTVRKLLNDKNIDINEINACSMASPTMGYTPLMCAVEKGNIEIVKLFIEKGADINVKSGRGTALHIAVEHGYIDIAKLLLDKGADVSTVGSPGPEMESPKGTPLQIAQLKGNTVLVHLLTQAEKKQIAKYDKDAFTVKSDTPEPAAVKSDVDEIPAVKTRINKNAFAIVIGIENYRQKLPKADFAASDAKIMTEYLTKVLGYPEENVITMTNENATNVDMAKYIEEWLPKNSEPGSSVFIYYSGHGAPNPKTGDAYLVPYDGDPNFIEKTGYPLKKLYGHLARLPAKQIIVALDSCFSGAGGKSVLAEGSRPLVMNMRTSFTPADNMIVLSASSGSEISSTYKDKGHGLFTYFFLKGIKGDADLNEDGKIEVDELYFYLKPQVQKTARKLYNNEQSPQLMGSPDNQKIFLRQ